MADKLKIVEVTNYGFSDYEIECLSKEFLSLVSNVKLTLEENILLEVFELPEIDCIIIATYRNINNRKSWESKIFSQDKILRIVANLD